MNKNKEKKLMIKSLLTLVASKQNLLCVQMEFAILITATASSSKDALISIIRWCVPLDFVLIPLTCAHSKHTNAPFQVIFCVQMENADRTAQKYTQTDVRPISHFFVLQENVFSTVLSVLISDANLISHTFVQIFNVPKTLLTVLL